MTTSRQYLLEGAERFVRAASGKPGVKSISLIGSITTTKPKPKDIDLLLIITDEADVANLALHGRRLQGWAQQQNMGADIFLADELGNYLGRTCHWKECRFGKRMSCDARNCGLRPHLHDDLDTVCLKKETVLDPPVTFWPKVVRRIQLPPDVEEIVALFEIQPAGARAGARAEE